MLGAQKQIHKLELAYTHSDSRTIFTMLKLKGAIETLKDHTRDELQEKLGVRQSSIVMSFCTISTN